MARFALRHFHADGVRAATRWGDVEQRICVVHMVFTNHTTVVQQFHIHVFAAGRRAVRVNAIASVRLQIDSVVCGFTRCQAACAVEHFGRTVIRIARYHIQVAFALLRQEFCRWQVRVGQCACRSRAGR